MTVDFSPTAGQHVPDVETDPPPTSTDLARTYGLDGGWTVGPGVELLVAFLDSVSRPWCPRTVRPTFTQSWHASAVEVVPAVGGTTVWPAGQAPALLVELPNHLGALEDPAEAGGHGPLGVLLRPVLAGEVTLPPSTRAVALDLGRFTVSIAPGPDAPLDGLAARWAAVDPPMRRAVAGEATARARRLAKKVNQLRAVATPLGSPTTGSFVVTTPRDPQRVLESMNDRNVAGGIPVQLPEHPGGIVVTCHADHSEGDLDRYVDAMEAALA